LFLLLPLLAQAIAIELGQGTTNLPKSGPCLLRLASDLGMFGRNIQRAALAILSISNVEVRTVEALGVAKAGATGIAATAGRFREAALDHGFGGTQESDDELALLLTHSLILR